MPPIPTEWWFRPLSSAARVGEQSAVVWKRVYFRPLAASFTNAGVWHGPPNALDAPNPTSSIKITSTLGAPVGGRSGTIGGIRVSGSLALYVVTPTYGRSGIGRISRCRASAALGVFVAVGFSLFLLLGGELLRLLATRRRRSLDDDLASSFVRYCFAIAT